ncbi:MAG: homocysteine S-methyltransferase family protein, partial [Bdellovibrionales bacterium]
MRLVEFNEKQTYSKRGQDLVRTLCERIVILDGAMGTMIQRHKLAEADYRGGLFKHFAKDQKGNNELLVLSQPQIIKGIHREYLLAGADIVETDTFNATRIAMADFGTEQLVNEINLGAARLAREAADEVEKEQGRICWVAGSIGPMNRSASLSPDVNQPGLRNITFDELVEAYQEQVKALLEGGVDLLLP